MNNPFVSILCSTYNNRDFIKSAIDSFLSQKTRFSIEILIHDDASTDGTVEIIKDYQNTFPHIISLVFQEENQYMKGVRGMITKHLLPRAKGKYISLCEGDDYFTDSNKLQKQVNILEKNSNFSGCFHETQLVNEDGTNGRVYGYHAPDIVRVEDTISTLSPFHTSSLMFRNIPLQIPPWFYHVVSKDMALFSILASIAPLIKIPQIMSVYRKHKEGLTNRNEITKNIHRDRIILLNHLNDYHNYKHDKKVMEVIATHNKMMQTNSGGTIDKAPNLLKRFISFLRP